MKTGKVALGGSTAALLERNLLSMRDVLDTTIAEVRLSAGSQDIQRVPVAGFLRNVQESASLQAQHYEMNLTFSSAPETVTVHADPQLLASALFNLLQNAFKYSATHGQVAVRTVCDDRLVSIEVEDECGGLPEGNTETFFEAFGARGRKDRSGLGLGLNVSRKAVRSFGGDIRVRNLPGQGCIFTIELPVAAI